MVYNFYEIILLVVLIVSLILKIPINLFNKTFVLGTLVLLFTIDFNTLSLLE